jgi:hypothetical protein
MHPCHHGRNGASSFPAEGSIVPFPPDPLANQQEERLDSEVEGWGSSLYDASPCSCDLRLGCQGLAARPGGNKRPNLLGDGTIEEEMLSRLQVPHAKLAEILVRPLSML